ncbi:MAG: hypothetical protein ASARMPREDX12_009161 [Alectoria sarmentosa]|nr:MAG: hypothetical protein ASARMPREDX12_009161 [Alectoria sarmentosa]
MLSLKLFHLCLLLVELNLLSGIMFAASVPEESVSAEIAITTERKIGRTLFDLPQTRAHRAKILGSLHGRGDGIHVLTNGWLMKFLRIDSGIPIAIASALLEDFYQRVLDFVQIFTITTPPLKKLSLFVLDLYLDFTCDSTEVSWDFVKAFATAMLAATKKGFTGKFQAIVFHGPTETVVNVALRVMGSPEPSDSTQTNTGLRKR